MLRNERRRKLTAGLVKGDYVVVVTVLEDGTDGTVTVTQAE